MTEQIKTTKRIKIIAGLIFAIGLIIVIFLINLIDRQKKIRILYIKENKVFSILENGKGLIDLSKRGIQLDSYHVRSTSLGEPIIISNDRKKIYFVKNCNVWSANTDGTQVKQITNNTSISPPFEIFLAGMSNDKTKLLFTYQPIRIIDRRPIINPNIKYGYYYYDSSTDTVKYIGEKLPIEEIDQSDFVRFVGNEPIYANSSDGYLYKLDLNRKSFSRFLKVPIPAIFNDMYINKEKGFLIYRAHYSKDGWDVWRDDTIPDDYSQIVLFNYKNGTKIDISKAGTFAEYQPLFVSPKFQNVIFGHQIYYTDKAGRREKRVDYYHYNTKTKQTNLLPLNTFHLEPLWINEDVFLYAHYPKIEYSFEDLLTVYKFDLKSGKQTKFLEKVNALIIP